MSIDLCDRCGTPVDTDGDYDPYVSIGEGEYACFCEPCYTGDDYTEDHRLDDPRHSP